MGYPWVGHVRALERLLSVGATTAELKSTRGCARGVVFTRQIEHVS
jgi:hypothetical protein